MYNTENAVQATHLAAQSNPVRDQLKREQPFADKHRDEISEALLKSTESKFKTWEMNIGVDM